MRQTKLLKVSNGSQSGICNADKIVIQMFCGRRTTMVVVIGMFPIDHDMLGVIVVEVNARECLDPVMGPCSEGIRDAMVEG